MLVNNMTEIILYQFSHVRHVIYSCVFHKQSQNDYIYAVMKTFLDNRDISFTDSIQSCLC